MKTVHIETSEVSYPPALPRWRDRRPGFWLLVSQLVLEEPSAGHSGAAERRGSNLADIPLLSISDGINYLADAFSKEGTSWHVILDLHARE